MLKNLLPALLLSASAAGWAATDANTANQAELESIKGIGPALSTRLLEERAKRPFKDWADLRARVSGVGKSHAARLSDGGLTVGGAPYSAQADGK